MFRPSFSIRPQIIGWSESLAVLLCILVWMYMHCRCLTEREAIETHTCHSAKIKTLRLFLKYFQYYCKFASSKWSSEWKFHGVYIHGIYIWIKCCKIDWIGSRNFLKKNNFSFLCEDGIRIGTVFFHLCRALYLVIKNRRKCMEKGF